MFSIPGYKIAGFLLLFVYITHVLACGWYYVGTIPSTIGGAVVPGWVASIRANASDGHVYLNAFHSVNPKLSDVGYGNSTAVTDAEVLFSICTELCVGLIFGLLAGA